MQSLTERSTFRACRADDRVAFLGLSAARLCAWALIVLAMVVPSTAVSRPADDAREKVRSLREKAAKGKHLYERDGNPCREIIDLMILRFEATSVICDEIDRVESAPNEAYLAGLYRLLGTVRDPATIPWLRQKESGAQAAYMYDAWLGPWTVPSYLASSGSVYMQWAWLEERDKWATVFRDLTSKQTDNRRRLRLLTAMATCFHDDATVAFFVRREREVTSQPREVLLVQTYLWSHGKAVDGNLLQQAIDRLSKEDGEVPSLLAHAEVMRHEKFVPWLIELWEHAPKYRESADSVLRGITFALTGSGEFEDWREWYERYGHDGREKWLRRAMDEVLADPKRGAGLLSTEQYNWAGDIALAPFVAQWIGIDDLADEVPFWVCSMAYPQNLERLKPLAKKWLESQALSQPKRRDRCLVEFGLLGGPKETWAQHVRDYAMHP